MFAINHAAHVEASPSYTGRSSIPQQIINPKFGSSFHDFKFRVGVNFEPLFGTVKRACLVLEIVYAFSKSRSRILLVADTLCLTPVTVSAYSFHVAGRAGSTSQL